MLYYGPMERKHTVLSSIGIVLLSSFWCSEALGAPSLPNQEGQVESSAVISGPSEIAVNRTLVLDATASKTYGEKSEYRWIIEETNQLIGKGVEIIYTPEKTGKLTFQLTVRSRKLDGKMQESVARHSVVVFSKKIVLIADTSVSREKLDVHTESALQDGVYLSIVQPNLGTPLLAMEDSIASLLLEKKDVFTNTDVVLLWTEGIYGLQALMRSIQTEPERRAQIENSTLVLISESGLSTLERTVVGIFSSLKPQQIIITRKEAVNPLLNSETIESFKEALQKRDIDYALVSHEGSGLRPWNILTTLVTYLLSHGVSSQTVILLLMLPIIATIFTFLKQVVGITTFGLYTPSIIALSFLSLGFIHGVLFLLFILFTGYIARRSMQRWRLLYVPKVAIILTVVSLSLLLLVAIGTRFGLKFSRDSVFMLLILSTLAENFLNLKTEEGIRSALFAVAETLLGSLICVLIVQWQALQSVILAYPESLLITIVINAFLGRWTGLRIVEYFRFREIFKHIQEE